MPGWSILLNLDEQIMEFPIHPEWAARHVQRRPTPFLEVHSTVWDEIADFGFGDEFWEWVPEL